MPQTSASRELPDTAPQIRVSLTTTPREPIPEVAQLI